MSFVKLHPILVLASLYFISSGLILSAAALYVVTRPAPRSGLGEYHSPWMVLTTVPGITGPAVTEAGILTIRGTRCVDGNKILPVEVSRYFTSLDDPPRPTEPEIVRERQSRGPGCNTTDIPIQLPATVKPGLWRIDGVSRSIAGGEIKTYFSETFRVVSKG